MSDENDVTEVAYRLAETRVEIAGTSETEAAGTRRRLMAADAAVSLRTAADPHESLVLRLPARAKADGTFVLTLSDDQRLLGTNATSTGRGGSAVKTLVSAVSTVAGLVTAGLGAAAGVGGLRRLPAAPATWASAHPELAAREANLRATLTKGEEAHDDLTSQAIDEEDTTVRSRLLRRREDIARLMVDTAAELTRIDARRSAWQAAQADRRSSRHTFVFDVDDLPTDAQVATWPEEPGTISREQAGLMHGPLAVFGLVVTGEDVTRRATLTDEPDIAGGAYDGVYYRRPRQVKLRVYRVVGVEVEAGVDIDLTPIATQPTGGPPAAAPPASEAPPPAAPPAGEVDPSASKPSPFDAARDADLHRGKQSNGGVAAVVPTGPRPWLVLVEEREVEIVDKHCHYGYLPFTSAWFGERAATVAFGPLGSPTSISTSNVSVLRDLADLAAVVPGQVVTGLQTANQMIDQAEVAWGQADAARLASLQQRKQLLESELALSDAEGNAEVRSEVAKLGAEHDLLVARRDAATARYELSAALSADEAESVRVQQRVERLELEAKVTRLESDAAITAVAHENRLLALRAEAERLEQLAARLAAGTTDPNATTPVVPPPTGDGQ